jgi:fructosamine-3-kinase
MKPDDLELFDRFNTEMYKEYIRHYPKNGDSWKTTNEYYLLNLLRQSIQTNTFYELENNPSHFIDIANFALFCYYRFSEFALKTEESP